jgi:hypothetical protein
VLAFLEKPKRRREVEEEFHLSNTQSYNLIQWLKNGKFIKERCFSVAGNGKVWMYRKK